MTNVLAIYRDECFSPNSVEKDKAILDETGNLLRQLGFTVAFLKEIDFNPNEDAQLILSMGRLKRTLDLLEFKESQGSIIINSPHSVNACARSYIYKVMRDNNIPTAPLIGPNGYWLKRGDQAAQVKNDVVFARNEYDMTLKLNDFNKRGIYDVLITAHVLGDCVKFYGVRSTGFFMTFYPCDDGDTKFGNETINGVPHHYNFSVHDLENNADKLASLTGTDVYGGDCIIRSDGSYAIIDFNDWPSFARCRQQAAHAILSLIIKKLHFKTNLSSNSPVSLSTVGGGEGNTLNF
ncbi:MAG: hypothetical protein LUC88_07490 [Prevotella sp.]|nr:hypothetical protein [Prevotella sp.]